MQQEVEIARGSQQDQEHQWQEDFQQYEKRIQFLSDELDRLRSAGGAKEESLRNVQLAIDSYKDKCYQLEGELSHRIEEIDMLREQIKQRDLSMDQFFLNKGSEATFKLELEQVREDNKRLLKMLKQTKEYRDFTDFVDDSGGQARNISVI